MNPDSVSAQVPDIADGVSEATKASTTEVQTIISRKRKKTNAQKCREYRERKKLQNTMVQNITAKRSDECSETDQIPAKKPKTDAERRKKYYEAQKLKKQKSKKIPKTAKQRNKECYDRKKKRQALNTLNHHSDVLLNRELHSTKMDEQITTNEKEFVYIEIDIKQEPDLCTQDKDESDSELKCENVIVKTENDELYQDHTIKDDIVGREATTKYLRSTNMEDKQITSNKKNYVYIEIKQEHDTCTQDKDESDSELVISEDITLKTENDELYQDHTMKEEIVIEPEVVQTCTNTDSDETNSDDNNHCDTSSMEKTPVSCELCNKVISSQRYLNYHMKYYCPMNEKIIPVSCQLCNKPLSSLKFLERHMKNYCLMNKDIAKPVSCELCNEVLSSQKYLNNHMKYSCPMNEKIKPVSCQLCDKVISSQRYLNNHMKYSCPMNDKIKSVSCNLCNKVLSSQKYLNNHMKYSCSMNKNKTKPTCKLCNETINSRGSLYHHLKNSCSMNKNKK